MIGILFKNYMDIIVINNDSLNFNEIHPNRIARDSLKSKVSPWSLELNKNYNKSSNSKTFKYKI